MFQKVISGQKSLGTDTDKKILLVAVKLHFLCIPRRIYYDVYSIVVVQGRLKLLKMWLWL
jgi:hypothetical protein